MSPAVGLFLRLKRSSIENEDHVALQGQQGIYVLLHIVDVAKFLFLEKFN